MTQVINTGKSSTLTEQFEALARRWRAETGLLSSTTGMVNHPAYQAIIALGLVVVPLLLRDLETEPVHWFEALRSITGEDPVPREHWGDMAAMRLDWLNWGRQRGLL